MAKNREKAPETLYEVIGYVALAAIILFGLLWFLNSHKIVYYTSPMLRWIGLPWAVISSPTWEAINTAYVFYRDNPRQVGLVNFLAYINTCIQPAVILCAIAMTAMCAMRFRVVSASSLRRRLQPEALMNQISGTFTNIIPVMHLGESLMKDRLPKWRRQTFASDIWQNEKIGGLPISSGDHIFEDRVREYFRGGPANQMRAGRRWSKTLGVQVVDLARDGQVKRESFSNRFTSEGKILLGLFAAHAFGGREGKADYHKCKDQLNLTCAGQKDGMPNLAVGQWIFDKYKSHPKVLELYAIHHWEYTYLYALFIAAKVNGKAVHSEWIWLKPTNRILFYVLNTVGRTTPHAEAAAAFSQFDYERKVAKKGWLPFEVDPATRRPVLAADGLPVHQIMIDHPVEDMIAQFKKFQTQTDGGDDWIATRQKGFTDAQALAAMASLNLRSSAALAAAMASGAPPETAFDKAMQKQREASEKAAKDAIDAAVKQAESNKEK